MSEALRLADEIARIAKWSDSEHWDTLEQTEAELRRLHALNAELVEALTTCVCAMQDYQAGIGITEMFDKGERMGRAALAKAQGETK